MDLRSIRKNRNLTVRALSEKSEVPIRTIEDIEKNRNCKVNTAIKLADALGITLDELCRN